MTVRVSAIVLAAGESSRMGSQKALLSWHGVPLIEYQLRQFEVVPAIIQSIIVTGHEPAAIEAIVSRSPGALAVRNDDYKSGKVSSIRVGLAAVDTTADAVIILGVDQPRTAHMLARIIEAHASSGRAITAPTHRGRRGHPLVFSRALLGELASIEEQTMGLRAVVAAHTGDVHDVECDESVLVDLNLPADVSEAYDHARRERG
jgi:molybdenum cofactor cytidylyltransferase